VLRADVQDVDAEAVDGGLVLAPIVQHRLGAAPVVVVKGVMASFVLIVSFPMMASIALSFN
jgi:hypothetical protein